MKKIVLVLLVGVLGLAGMQSTQAGLLGTYTFDGADVVSPPSGDYAIPTPANNIVWGVFSPVGGLTRKNASDVYTAASFATANAINTSQYLELTLKPDSGYYLSLDYITFDIIRGKNGPASGQVGIFVDGTQWNGVQDFSPGTTTASVTFNFNDLASVQNNQLVSFRFYGWNAGNSGNDTWLSFDNLAIDGSVSNVPEPVNVALGVFAGVFSVAGLARTDRVRRLFRRAWPRRSPLLPSTCSGIAPVSP